jgi:hypothetical protein
MLVQKFRRGDVLFMDNLPGENVAGVTEVAADRTAVICAHIFRNSIRSNESDAILFFVLYALLLPIEVCAQSQIGHSSPPIVGSSGVSVPLQSPTKSWNEGQGPRQHMGPVGKPCVTVGGVARPQNINPHIFEHVLTANNSCSRIIKLLICYFQSDRCIGMTVPSFTHTDTVLGIASGMKDFRFQYWEEFP